ncbi:MAG: antibiotic biosynthesis monooxygenase [Christiangramia sp.]|nr:antibiotic biosynthesis monooxygenase [Christiangramia sp.]|tara:strand:+ start:844 stop:1158 length:315 start_codon:yes stop_codon:yes gene_type:complete
MIAKTPEPPYYAVIFTSLRTDENDQEYGEMAQKMLELAIQQPGYLGFESAKSAIGISVSYWKDLDSIRNSKRHSEHLLAQKLGKSTWYEAYKVRIALVERDYQF